jgi:hypothetical protein
MTKIATNSVAKLAVVFTTVAMLFTLAAPAQAQISTEELQDMINSLLQQIADLESQMGTGSGSGMGSTASVCPNTWTRSLSQGDTGLDVMKLQQFLNADAATQVAMSGAGSPGMETEYYGPATAAAVTKFQELYRADVLTPVNLVSGTGYFGPSTMAKANELCASAPTTPAPDLPDLPDVPGDIPSDDDEDGMDDE